MEIDELAIKITGDSTSLQSALKNATDEMNKLGINTSTLSTLLGAAGLTAIFKMAFDAANQMVEAFRGDEVAALKYNAALQASNKITNEGKAALDAYVPVFASLSGIAEADTQSMIAMLAAYGRTDEQIKTMMQTAQGMANVLGIDVNTALTQLNMTFSGTTGRLAQQTPALKDLTAEQLKNGEGVKLLAEKYAQFSDVLKDSTDVSIKNYQNAYSDMMSAMGSSIAATLKPLRDAMTDAFRWIADDKTGERAKNTLQIIELGLVAIVAAINPVAGAISGAIILITNLIGQVSAAQKAAADAAANAAAKWAEANKGQADDLDAMRLKALTVAQDRAAEEKKTADATAKAWEDAEKKIIEGRKTASKQYTDTLAQIDTRVKLGIMTEQEAADAKYAANKKLIDDLIALGYTGAAASKSIGDKTLREAIDRLHTYESAIKESLQQTADDIKAQELAVAEWSADYLGKQAFQQMMDNATQAIQNQEVADWEADYLGKLAFKALMDKAEEAIQEQDVSDWEADYLGKIAFQKLMDNAEQAIQEQEVADWEADYLGKIAFQKLMDNATQAIQDQEVADWEADYLGKIAFQKLMDNAEQAIQEQDVADWEADYLGKLAFQKLMDNATQAIQDQEVADWEADYLGKIAFQKLMDNAIEAIQNEEVADWEASYLGKKAFEALMSQAEQAIQNQEVTDWEADYLGKIAFKALMDNATQAIQNQEVADWEADYLGKIAFKALMDNATEAIQNQEVADWEADYLGKLAFKALMDKAEEALQEQSVADWEADYLGKQAFATLMANAEQAFQEQDVEAWSKQFLLLQSKNLLALSDNEYRLTMVQGSELDKRIATVKANLAKDLAANENNETLKKALIAKAEQDIAIIRINAAQKAIDDLAKIGNAFNTIIESNAKKQQEQIDIALKGQIAAYEAEKQAALEAAGLANKTTLETLQEKVDAAYAAGDAEEIAAAEAALKKQQIIEEYNAKELAATKKAEYDKAVIKYKADIAQYGVNIAMAVAQGALAIIQAFAQLGPIAGAIAAAVVAATTAAQIVVMANNKPQPPAALALGGVAGGRTIVGERGAEIVDLPMGSYVHDAEESKRIAAEMKAANQTFIFNSPIALTPAEMKRQFKLAQRRAAFMGAI